MLTMLWRITPFILLAAALAAHRAAWTPRPVPEVRFPDNVPHTVAPRFDDPRVVTDFQLYQVLERMKPHRKPVHTNAWLHALRLWGPNAAFGDSAHVDGAEIRDFLLNDAAFQQYAGNGAAPLFDMEENRVVIHPWFSWDDERDFASAHTDDVLATFGEIGLPLDTPLFTRRGTTTVGAAVASSLARFHRKQLEYEWSAITYARYVFPVLAWTNQYGQRIDAKALIDELIDHPPREGVCAGTHRLEALVVLLAADDQCRALPWPLRHRILLHLAQTSARLAANQHADGYWTRDWGATSGTPEEDEIGGRILATGHHLEWQALAPQEVQLPRESIIRAAQWLVRAVTELDDRAIDAHYGPFTHAARALCLWRSRDPFEVWSRHRDSKLATKDSATHP